MGFSIRQWGLIKLPGSISRYLAVLVFAWALLWNWNTPAEAATHTWVGPEFTITHGSGSWYKSTHVESYSVYLYSQSQGIFRATEATVTVDSLGGSWSSPTWTYRYRPRVTYEVPSDGVAYAVIGTVVIACERAKPGDHDYPTRWSNTFTFTANHQNPGTFTGASIGAAATAAQEARDKANQALTEINNVKASVTNIQTSVSNLSTPPTIQKIHGLNGATATSNPDGTFWVTVQTSGATHFRAGTSPGSGSAVPVGSPAPVTLSPGINTIYVEAWDESRPDVKATGQMTAFRLN